MRKIFLFGLGLSVAVLLTLGANRSPAQIIDSVTKDMSHASGREYAGKGGVVCSQLQNVTFPDRTRRHAFLHRVNRCGKRSEFRMKKTEIGKTYWYGWSMFIPSDWSDQDAGFDIVNQWATYPANNKSFNSEGCSAVGSYIARNFHVGAKTSGYSKDRFDFVLQHAGDSTKIECNRFPLGKVSELRGKWVDYVMNVKWTGNKDGFVKLWMKIGNGSYTQKVDYKGRTFWNDEGTGPYFKMGDYKGGTNFKGPAPRTVYTAEYRLGNANSSFREVAPGTGSRFCNYIPWLCQ